MSIDKKIMDELKRYNSINKYISEQEVPPLPGEELPPPPAGDVPPAGEAPAALPPAEPQVVDTVTDPDVEKVDSAGESEETTTEGGSEELDITDLVNSQKNVETKQQEYFDKLFSHIEGLESKLGEMDKIVSLLNTLEQKVEKYRPRTAQEKLDEMETKLNEQIQRNIALNKKLAESAADSIFNQVSEGLALSQKDKLASLVVVINGSLCFFNVEVSISTSIHYAI